MTEREITALYQAEQLNILYTEASFLAKRGSGNSSILLLQFEDWYVEIHYYYYRCEVNKIIFSKDMDILDPYLDQIDIGELNLAH